MAPPQGALDFGRRLARKRVPRWALAAAVAGVAAAVTAAIWVPSLLAHRADAISTARAWTIHGPPCQALTPAASRKQWYKASKAFEWDGVTFARGAGHASCQDVGYRGGRGLGVFPVCQFTSPEILAITTGKGTFYFAPGLGRPATVSVQHGLPSCVAASNFTLQEPS